MRTKKKQGFAAISKERQLQLASKGGKSAWASGKAHRFTSEEARIAGRKGGKIVSRDRKHMSAIARRRHV